MSRPALVFGTLQAPRPADAWQALSVAQTNRSALARLEAGSHGLDSECFHMPPSASDAPLLWVFASHCPQPEQHWLPWLDAFEAVLTQMVWSEVQLNLQTPWHGAHYLRWQAGPEPHQPGQAVVPLRTDWEHDAGFFRFG